MKSFPPPDCVHLQHPIDDRAGLRQIGLQSGSARLVLARDDQLDGTQVSKTHRSPVDDLVLGTRAGYQELRHARERPLPQTGLRSVTGHYSQVDLTGTQLVDHHIAVGVQDPNHHVRVLNDER